MIEQPTPNVQLTFEQLQQIDTAQTRLTNIQNEVFIASKLLSETRNDAERITKEKEYQQSIVDGLNTDIEDLVQKKAALITEKSELEQYLIDAKQKSDATIAVNESKILELNDREDSITAREIAVDKKELKINKQSQELEESKKDIEVKKNKIQQIIDSL